jgi:hypothetical protein
MVTTVVIREKGTKRVALTQYFNDPRPGGQATLFREGDFCQEWYQSEYKIECCRERGVNRYQEEGYQKRQHNAS